MANLKDQILAKAQRLNFQNFDIEHPKNWCEKIQWLQIHDDIDLRSLCADKIKVHDYSIRKLNKDICVPILKIYKSPNNIFFKELPNRFVLKCNHGYNYNIIVKNKKDTSQAYCKQQLRTWLNEPFGEVSIEPHYLKIKRCCYAEKYLENENQQALIDYKFLCFNGIPKYCQVLTGRHTNDFHLNYYDMDFNFVDISRLDIRNNPNQLDTKPNNFELMKFYAKILSKDFRFVRVDFYEVDDIVYLGELTFTPATGFIRWTDPTIDRMFGDLITL